MLCPYCGHFSTTDNVVCGRCGKLLPRERTEYTGVQAIRQGKRARDEYMRKAAEARGDRQTASAEAQPAGSAGSAGSNPEVGSDGRAYVNTTARRTVASEPLYADSDVFDEKGAPMENSMYRRASMRNEGARDVPHKMPDHTTSRIDRHAVNWAKVLLFSAIFVLVLLVGTALFLTRTSSGQRIMARAGFTASSTAYWEVGDEKMDTGDIDGAISDYLKAEELDGEDNVNVAGLLALGGAYEAAGRLDDAEALYVRIYTDIAPSATEAYTNVIRIMLADGRDAQAAELMTYAYTKTGSSSFSSQRSNLLPSPPSVNIAAGYYEENKTLRLTADEGCDIYYTFDENAQLPYGGTLYTQPLSLTEKTWPLRAVAVNGDLVSDELKASYTISMPAPGMPYPSLASNTYTQRQRVRLFQNIERTREPDIVIYYTIDGSEPDSDSPIYDQDATKGILLPGGRVTLRAVSVNSYGKASNTLEVGYKIEAKPYPLTAYSTDDTANGLRLNGTTYTDFVAAQGEPLSSEEIERSNFSGKVVKYTWSWGYAVFHNLKGTNTLIELYFTTGAFKGPRSTGIGDTLDYVVGKFRDMGQVEGATGNRGLYYNDDGMGRIYVNGNGTKRAGEEKIIYADQPADIHVIRYTCETADSHIWSLDYITDTSDKVTAIDMLYIP